jgi:hypothetical protein
VEPEHRLGRRGQREPEQDLDGRHVRDEDDALTAPVGQDVVASANRALFDLLERLAVGRRDVRAAQPLGEQFG